MFNLRRACGLKPLPDGANICLVLHHDDGKEAEDAAIQEYVDLNRYFPPMVMHVEFVM